MSDEELDALFQRGAAAYPDEMPAAAWARMETKLDDAARTQQLRRKVGRFFAGELLLIALLLWQVARITTPTTASKTAFHQPAASQAVARTTATTPTEVATHGSSFNSILRRANTAPVPSANTTPTPHLNSAPASHANTAPVPSPDPRRSVTASLLPARPAASAALATAAKASEPTHPPITTILLAAPVPAHAAKPHRVSATRLAPAKDDVSNANTAVASPSAKKARSNRQLTSSHIFANAGGNFTPSQPKPRPTISSLPTVKLAQQSAGGAGESVAPLAGRVVSLAVTQYPLPEALRPLAVQPPAADTAQPPRRRAPRPPYRVLVGLLAGPSFSGVRTAQTAQLGADYGLTLEYRFSSKWRVRAGLLSSQKNYLAASTDYEAPAAWQWFAGTYDLTANCRITEIPLDLRYDVLSKPAYTVFTSLGVNSLLMRNERYSYDWTANGQTFTKSAEVRKGSNHFLSVLNVSVGFEKPLGQRWSAQVEPFWQFPLGGVGAGKVHLTSAGASFSLKFGLLK